MGLYMGWSDVTESMATIRSPFCGYNVAKCVELTGEDLSRVIQIKSNLLVNKNVRMIINLPTKKRISAISQWKTFIRVYPQDGGESLLASKLRHCHRMYTAAHVDLWRLGASLASLHKCLITHARDIHKSYNLRGTCRRSPAS